MENKRKHVLKAVLSLLVLGAIALLIYILFRHFGLTWITKEELRSYIKSTGALAPIIYILICFAQTIVAPIPGAVVILAGNLLFGPFLGFLYSYIGTLIGAMVCFFLGRAIGRPFINWLAGSKEKVDSWIGKLKGRQNVLLFFMFFLPFFPDDILCAIAGILPISTGTFFIMQLITRATSSGATLLFMSGEVIPFRGWGLIVLAVIAIISIAAFVVSIKYADKINSFFNNIVNKLFPKKSATDKDGEEQ